jgi:hypothetical protein
MATQTGIVKWEPQILLARLKEAEDAKVFPTDRNFTPAMRSAFAQVAVLYRLDPMLGEIMPYQGRIYIPIAGRRRKDDEAENRASFRFEPLTKPELQAYIDTAGFSEGDTPARCIATALDGRTVDRVARVRKTEGQDRDGKPSPFLPTSVWRFEMACKRAERFCREILWGPIVSPLTHQGNMVIEGEPGVEMEPAVAIAAPPADPAAILYQGDSGNQTPVAEGACVGHYNAPMYRTRQGALAHRLPDRSLCYGMPANEETAGHLDGLAAERETEGIFDDGTPLQGDGAPADLPSSTTDDLAALKAEVEATGMSWPNFQRDVLGMAWSAWLQTRGTVASARERLRARREGG